MLPVTGAVKTGFHVNLQFELHFTGCVFKKSSEASHIP